MNSFYNTEELQQIGFKNIGKNVLISKKASIYSPNKISIGNNVRIDDFCILSGNITLGNYIHIAAFCALYGSNNIIFEDFSGLSPRCTIFSSSDDFNGNNLISPMTLPEHNKFISGQVTIRKFAQIGTNSTLFPNITIAEGTAIGAHSLVLQDTEEWNIYIGVPAKKVKKRNKKLIELSNDDRYK